MLKNLKDPSEVRETIADEILLLASLTLVVFSGFVIVFELM